ncbi:hypothetical protein K2173_024497 [Erythroxylum novogranatense]|uniref:Beta-fructofuranosidase n=1 Tax=Erythroxylum novogranatense TaxID=1862640 RepID=A0AAV8SUH6_9ROSI|nr:hypothetical protein K2173_024497 [Erythroxylum novogranatense]
MNFPALKLFLLLCLLLFLLQFYSSCQVFRALQDLQNSSNTPDQPYRTGYHFQPLKNWMNDPNGPMVYKGIYHLFYQYNPKGAVWGNIVWAHSTSLDLVNWKPQPIAIYPSQLMLMAHAILYRGINQQGQQVQCLAFPKDPSDPYLIEWVKPPQNPVMTPTIHNRIDPSIFRDPTTAWLGLDGAWRVIVGSKVGHKGLAILYRSKDFVHWVQAKHPLHSATSSGMWECPDLFPVAIDSQVGVEAISRLGTTTSVKFVFKASLDGTKHDVYTIGTYDLQEDVYTPDVGSVEGDSGLRYEYGKFYGSKTFFDNVENRRVLWGWINESSTESEDIKKGWSGIQAIPRTIWLDRSRKQLVQWPIKKIEMLRTNPVSLPSQAIEGGSMLEVSGVTAVQADVEISFQISEFERAEKLKKSWTNAPLLCSQKGASTEGSLGPFGLLVLASKDMQEYTAVFFRIFKDEDKYVVLMCSDQSSFGGEGKSCITARVYPTLAINDGAHLYAFNYGTQSVKITRLNAWSMKKAGIN